MQRYLIAYSVSMVSFVIIDGIWLGFLARPLYRDGLGHLMAASPNLVVAAVFYLLMPIGLVVFAIAPALAGMDAPVGGPGWQRAVAMGALFGFFCYATYDLSNLATLKDWPRGLTFIDIAWGTALSAVAAGLGHAAGQRFG